MRLMTAVYLDLWRSQNTSRPCSNLDSAVPILWRHRLRPRGVRKLVMYLGLWFSLPPTLLLGYSPRWMHLACESSVTCMLNRSCRVRLFETPWTVAHQAPLSMGFFRQEYWSGLLFPPPEDLPNPGLSSPPLCLLHWPAGSLPVASLGSSYCVTDSPQASQLQTAVNTWYHLQCLRTRSSGSA